MSLQLNILMFFQSIRSPFLNTMFLIFTISTEVPVIVLASALMYWCINKKYGQRMLFSLIGNFVINTGVKEFVKAPRPIGTPGLESMRVSTATGYSFPSGHAMSSAGLGLSLVVALWSSRWRWWAVGFATLYILFVGFSRLYLGVHYPTDVAAGWLVSAVWVLAVSLLVRSSIGHRVFKDS